MEMPRLGAGAWEMLEASAAGTETQLWMGLFWSHQEMSLWFSSGSWPFVLCKVKATGSFVSLKVYKHGAQFSTYFVKIVRCEGPLYVQIRNRFLCLFLKVTIPALAVKTTTSSLY